MRVNYNRPEAGTLFDIVVEPGDSPGSSPMPYKPAMQLGAVEQGDMAATTDVSAQLPTAVGLGRDAYVQPELDFMSDQIVEAHGAQRMGLGGAGRVTMAMRRVAPKPGKFHGQLSQAHHWGMLAAARRRANPVVAPQAWTPVLPPVSQNHNAPRLRGVEGMPRVALPVVEMIRDEMPDVVFACDRGGRMLGNAVFAVWHRLYPGAPFPTIDSALHFGRISKSTAREDTHALVLHMLYRSGAMAEMAQRKAEGDSRPLTVALLDDWVIGGGTVRIAREAIETALRDVGLNDRIRLVVGTMVKDSVTDSADRQVDGAYVDNWYSDWGDSGDSLGVEYFGYTDYSDVVPRAVRSPYARSLLRDLHTATKKLIQPSPHQYVSPTPRPALESLRNARRRSVGRRIADLLRRSSIKLANTTF